MKLGTFASPTWLRLHCTMISFYFNYCAFQVVGDEVDVCTNKVNPRSYESIYSLLDSVSPGYVQRFGEKLAGRLADLQQ